MTPLRGQVLEAWQTSMVVTGFAHDALIGAFSQARPTAQWTKDIVVSGQELIRAYRSCNRGTVRDHEADATTLRGLTCRRTKCT